MKLSGVDQIWFFIVNPAASNGLAGQQWPTLEQKIRKANLTFRVQLTTCPFEATTICTEAIQQGYRKIVAVGGDGTNNEVVNGIFNQKEIPTSDILYCLLPIGTGNDWIKTHQISTDIDTWIQNLKIEKTIVQDIGLVTYHQEGIKKQRYFVNVAGMAYDGFICQMAEQQKSKVANKLFYLWLIFKCLFQYQLRKARITFDDQVVEDYFYTINIGLCKYSGGGMQFVPHAIPDDGLFALTIARDLSKLQVILNTPQFYNTKVGSVDKVSIHQTRHILVESIDNEPTLLEVDGEFLGETPVEYFLIEKGLRIVI